MVEYAKRRIPRTYSWVAGYLVVSVPALKLWEMTLTSSQTSSSLWRHSWGLDSPVGDRCPLILPLWGELDSLSGLSTISLRLWLPSSSRVSDHLASLPRGGWLSFDPLPLVECARRKIPSPGYMLISHSQCTLHSFCHTPAHWTLAAATATRVASTFGSPFGVSRRAVGWPTLASFSRHLPVPHRLEYQTDFEAPRGGMFGAPS